MSLLRLLRSGSVRTLAVYLSIPIVMTLGVGLAASINPEAGVFGPFHIRMFWLLTDLRHTLFRGSELAVIGLWYLTCLFLVWAKGRSWGWSLLAVFGPFGLIALTMLGSNAPDPGPYGRWVRRMNGFLRAGYEVALFIAISVVADQAIVAKRPLVIAWQSYVTGFPTDEIIRQQEASGGMWAFGEFLETVYLIVLLYLIWPMCFNGASRLPRLLATAKYPNRRAN